MNAYNNLFKALHKKRAYVDAHLEACMKERYLSKLDDDKLQIQVKVAHQKIDRALNLGGFLLEDDTRARLRRYSQGMSNAISNN